MLESRLGSSSPGMRVPRRPISWVTLPGWLIWLPSLLTAIGSRVTSSALNWLKRRDSPPPMMGLGQAAPGCGASGGKGGGAAGGASLKGCTARGGSGGGSMSSMRSSSSSSCPSSMRYSSSSSYTPWSRSRSLRDETRSGVVGILSPYPPERPRSAAAGVGSRRSWPSPARPWYGGIRPKPAPGSSRRAPRDTTPRSPPRDLLLATLCEIRRPAQQASRHRPSSATRIHGSHDPPGHTPLPRARLILLLTPTTVPRM
mmetsp:Transcript_112051/g.317302  ORF Transcript_112051/g.317302 Transcript_112051/m.317302 type:complete len:257 (+) Transcript_112051:218-988(+)